MPLIAAPIAAPHVVDRRLRLSLLHLERRDQRVLRRYGHGSPLAGDVDADCEFERHAASPKAMFSARGRLDAHRREPAPPDSISANRRVTKAFRGPSPRPLSRWERGGLPRDLGDLAHDLERAGEPVGELL